MGIRFLVVFEPAITSLAASSAASLPTMPIAIRLGTQHSRKPSSDWETISLIFWTRAWGLLYFSTGYGLNSTIGICSYANIYVCSSKRILKSIMSSIKLSSKSGSQVLHDCCDWTIPWSKEESDNVFCLGAISEDSIFSCVLRNTAPQGGNHVSILIFSWVCQLVLLSCYHIQVLSIMMPGKVMTW